MSALQQLRDQLETALSRSRTRREEREIGHAIVELQEAADFAECAELDLVRLPSDFSLTSSRRSASAVTPHHHSGGVL